MIHWQGQETQIPTSTLLLTVSTSCALLQLSAEAGQARTMSPQNNYDPVCKAPEWHHSEIQREEI
jgi:hypothetical protein